MSGPANPAGRHLWRVVIFGGGDPYYCIAESVGSAAGQVQRIVYERQGYTPAIIEVRRAAWAHHLTEVRDG